MALTMYKPGQGYWTRLFSAIGWGTVLAAGALWLAGQLETVDENAIGFDRIYLQGGVVGALILIGGGLIYYLVYTKPSTSEFLIATESEMRKVNWSTRREIIGSTWVVIGISVIIAIILFVVDILFKLFFTAIGVLKDV